MKLLIAGDGIIDYRHPGQGMRDIAGAGFDGFTVGRGLDVVRAVAGLESPEYLGLERDKYEKMIFSPATGEPFIPDILDGIEINPKELNLLDKTGSKVCNELYSEKSVEIIRLAEKAGIEYVKVSPFLATDGSMMEENKRLYLKLAEVCNDHFTKILISNQIKYINGHCIRGFCSDGKTAAEFIDDLNKECGRIDRFAFCFDAGIASLCGQDMSEFIALLDKRIKAVTISDSNGHDFERLLPFAAGQTSDWLDLIRGLRRIDFDGKLILNIRDSARAYSPLLRPVLLGFAKSVGDYFIWQLGIERELARADKIVLFGAGNMCRAYMANYGDKYRPLFTCDNDSSLWGQDFEGLEVKNPAVLKNLDDDITVFICNIYYRDISAQLENMGVKNIRYFNDEYLPELPLGRVKRGLST